MKLKQLTVILFLLFNIYFLTANEVPNNGPIEISKDEIAPFSGILTTAYDWNKAKKKIENLEKKLKKQTELSFQFEQQTIDLTHLITEKDEEIANWEVRYNARVAISGNITKVQNWNKALTFTTVSGWSITFALVAGIVSSIVWFNYLNTVR